MRRNGYENFLDTVSIGLCPWTVSERMGGLGQGLDVSAACGQFQSLCLVRGALGWSGSRLIRSTPNLFRIASREHTRRSLPHKDMDVDTV